MAGLLLMLLVVSGCNDNSVKNIKADYFDIGSGQSYFGGIDKVDQATVQPLVKAYNDITYEGETSEAVNYEKSLSISFIYNDQISGTLVIDDQGVFELGDGAGSYQIEPSHDIYEQAMSIYNDVKKQY